MTSEDLGKQISRLMRRIRQHGGLLSSVGVVDETFGRLGYVESSMDPETVLAQFNDLLRRLWEESLVTLERHEERAYGEAIPMALMGQYPDMFDETEESASRHGFRVGTIRLFGSWYPALRNAFLSISQSRKQRGGKDFELEIEGLLRLAQIPFDRQEVHDHTDLIIPDLVTHQRNRNISAVVSVKRTLRERWAEVAEELFNLRSPNVFLFTADEKITQGHVSRICGRYNICLVVWDSVKAQSFADEPLVLGYTEWATLRLRILRQHWQQP